MLVLILVAILLPLAPAKFKRNLLKKFSLAREKVRKYVPKNKKILEK